MAKFQIENPGTVVGESIRCLSARVWRQEKFNGRGNWRIAFADVARLRWIVGGKDCRKILKALGFEPEPEKSYRTYNGRSQPLNLTINPKTWSLLSSIAR
jgi:hypothetical protein